MTTKRAIVQDLTQEAEQGKLEPAYGRERETLAIAEVLWRRQRELCPANQKRDEALRHVLRELSR